MRPTTGSRESFYKLTGFFLITGFLSVANAATSVTISDEAFGNTVAGRAAAATLDDAWVGTLPFGEVRPDLFTGTGSGFPYSGTKTFTDSILTPYQVDWQVGYMLNTSATSTANNLGPGTPTSIDFVATTTGGSVTIGTSTSIQSGAPNPYSSEARLSTGYSEFALNAVKLDFISSPTDIKEFGFFIGDLESRVNNGTAGRVIVFDEAGTLV